jgi:hypothetical protein
LTAVATSLTQVVQEWAKYLKSNLAILLFLDYRTFRISAL